MSAAVVALLVAAAVAAPVWVDALRGRAARDRLAIGAAPVDPNGSTSLSRNRGPGMNPGRPVGRQITTVVAQLGRIGAPVRRLARRPDDRQADARVGVAVVLAASAVLVAGPVVAAGVATAAMVVPALNERGHRRRAERAVRAALPDVVDLFRLAAGAGLSAHQAVEAVAQRAPCPMGAVLCDVTRRVALGERLGDALDAMDSLGEPARPLRSALASAARYGTPLASVLERLAEDARMLRRREAEERARRLPVQLLFPLVMCVLPAFGLLAVVPLLAGSLPAISDAR